MKESELIIEKGGVDLLPDKSLQNCVQTLEPLMQSSLYRTVNGELLSLSQTSQQKYKSVIACEDQCAAALDGVWPGERVRVGCLQWLSQPFDPGQRAINLQREAVGNICLIKDGDRDQKIRVQGRTAELPDAQSGGFVWYRPFLDMMVTQYHIKHSEWGTVVGWRLELEEV